MSGTSATALLSKRKRDDFEARGDAQVVDEAGISELARPNKKMRHQHRRMRPSHRHSNPYHASKLVNGSSPSSSSSAPTAFSSQPPSGDLSFSFVITPQLFFQAPPSRRSQSTIDSESSRSPPSDGVLAPAESKPSSPSEAGPSIAALGDSFGAVQLSTEAEASKRHFPKSMYGYAKSKPYRYTSPLSPEPGKKKRSKSRKQRCKTKSASPLLKLAVRNLLRCRIPPRSPSPPNPESVPQLDASDDDDDDDEFDDDELDEIIDFDDDESQLTDIVEMYDRECSPEPESRPFDAVYLAGGEEIVVNCVTAIDPISLSIAKQASAPSSIVKVEYEFVDSTELL